MLIIAKKFTKIPNKYPQCCISKEYGVSRKFYITYILIDRYKTREDKSWITVKKILQYYGYKITTHKLKSFYEVTDVLEFMINAKMISIEQDLDSITYDTGIEIQIIPENFYTERQWSSFYDDDFDSIMVEESTINKDVLLLSFLYINSYINTRQTQQQKEHPENYPEAFWGDLATMAKKTSMSKQSIDKCLKELLEKELLIKKTVGSVKYEDKPPQNVPNIYVLNKEGYEAEIKWAIQKMKDIYKVEEFNKPTKSKERIKRVNN